jgi:selenocysteine lyase/cysteine desulfurase
VVRKLHAAGLAVRHGHMYAYRLCEALGIDVGEGVVRVSAVHYNSPEEIERTVATLARN